MSLDASSLSPPPKIGRHFVLGLESTEVTPELEAFSQRFGLGGVVLFAKNCPDEESVTGLCEEIHIRLKDPDDGWVPLVMIDQEGGRVERLRDPGGAVPGLPPAAEMAKLEEGELEELAYTQSRALKTLGIDVNLAPVCDVVREGESGVIGDRAFGVDAGAVAANAAAFHRGMKRGPLLGCAKHFPGHGASKLDTHTHISSVGLTLEEVRAADLLPFARLANEGVGLVMAAHLTYPEVDAAPIFLSRFWLQEVLRGELGFTGAIITDDLEMRGARSEGGPVDIALGALFSGCDLLIFGGNLPDPVDPAQVAQGLEAVVPDYLLEDSQERLWRLVR